MSKAWKNLSFYIVNLLVGWYTIKIVNFEISAKMKSKNDLLLSLKEIIKRIISQFKVGLFQPLFTHISYKEYCIKYSSNLKAIIS